MSEIKVESNANVTAEDPRHHRYLPPSAMARGDIFPNFLLPDHLGAVRSFTERAKGNAIALFLDPSDTELARLRDAATAYDGSGLDRIAIIGGSEAEVSARAVRLATDFVLLADSAGKIRAQLREMTGRAAGTGSCLILLDRLQRVLAVIDNGDLVDQALVVWRSEPELEPARQLQQFAPVVIVPNVLTPADCRALIGRWEILGNEEGTVHSIVDGKETERLLGSMKKRRDHIIADVDLHRELGNVIGRRVAPELARAYNFSRFRFDRFIVTCYDAARGDLFRRHRDNQTQGTADRRFALTLNLNTDEYDGGELIFPEFGNHRYSPPAGGAILFSCSLLHEALPVTRGRRFTLLSFLRA